MSTIEIARAAFEHIKAENPHLKMEIEENPEHVELAMNIKKQPRLDFDVFLSLQNNDELHLQFEFFSFEWFPCTEPARVLEYETSVNGVLSGRFRTKVIELRGQSIKALLQAPSENGWSTVFTWSKMHLPLGAKTIRYVQNQSRT
ncbi:hypothetical protein [Microbulbifer thermotolerans]|uniref:hypothetical protein n=1 Tax=Microbulbifer thermotolerans TaxID=252514 RepID=UPI002248C565|nr:hypothetical protein [Microbulbifer thermotolerans]MCX2833087.1 hypothetical protein [Microbulbifer thermotolerans]